MTSVAENALHSPQGDKTGSSDLLVLQALLQQYIAFSLVRCCNHNWCVSNCGQQMNMPLYPGHLLLLVTAEQGVHGSITTFIYENIMTIPARLA